MRRRIAAILIALVVTGGAARADSFLDRSWGTPQPGLSARSRGMGGTGVATSNGSFSLADNPAALVFGSGSRVQLAGGIVRASEDRYVPLFDTFDSFVDEEAIAINEHAYGAAMGGVLWDPGRWHGLKLAAGVLERSDPRYDYYDERRTTATTDQIVSERFIRTRGTLRTGSLGAALPIVPRVGVGVTYHRWFGTIEDRDALVSRTPGVSGKVSELSRDITGWSFTLGSTWHVDERVDLGLAWETPPQLHDDYTQWQDDSVVSLPQSSVDVTLPSRLLMGVTYRPRNSFRTTFSLDAVYTPWSDLEDPLQAGVAYFDTWDFRFGLEHVYYNVLPGRIGFRYQQAYGLSEADRATFTFGLGYRPGRVAIDLSGELGKRSSRQEPLWPRDEQGSAVGTGRDRVEDTVLRVVLGADITF